MARIAATTAIIPALIPAVAGPVAAEQPPCAEWNTRRFFHRAGPDDVARCLAAGAAAGARLEARSAEGWTPLHAAVRCGRTPTVVAALLKADAGARNRKGWTPLHHAALYHRTSLAVSALLLAGADPNARTVDGKTTLHAAAQYGGYPVIVGKLLDAGADPSVRDNAGRRPAAYLKDRRDLPESRGYRRLLSGGQ